VPGTDSLILLAGLFLIVLTRFISVLLSPHASPELFWSIFRFVEAFALTWVLIALRATVFERIVVWMLVVITFFETFAGIAQVILSGGTQAGTGLASGRGIYELQILLTLWGLVGLSAGEGSRGMNSLKVVLGTLGVIVTVLRTAFFQLAIALFVVYWLMPKHGRRIYRLIIILGTIIVFILVGFVELQWPLMINRIEQISTMSGTIGVRLVLWQAAFSAFQLYPVTGIGSGAFGRNQLFYFDAAGVSFREGYTDEGLSVHNTVLGFLAETGIIGLVAYFIYAIGIAIIARRLSCAAPTTFNIALAGTVVSGIIIDFIAASSFYPITITLVALLASRYIKQKKA